MRVLIAEDEASIAGFMRDGLQEEGFVVDIATTGR
jgi:two-component system copper resistance phosphate regulon response regulator CusR